MPSTTSAIKGISSMATRQVLAELVTAFEQQSGCTVAIEAVGGVDAAKRVQAGEAFDVVVLASDAIDKLLAAGHLRAGSKVDLVRSGVAVAVRAGAPLPDISSEEALQRAVLAAPSISYSTGPSGVALAKLFERWGIASEIQGRMVQAPPGVPVGALVARGEVALGFQQLSELLHVEGITLVGPLPPAIQIVTTFSAGIHASVVAGSPQDQRVRALLDSMCAPQADAAKRRQGMDPALKRTYTQENT
jgi:molybdate transport system substrate-binding protein